MHANHAKAAMRVIDFFVHPIRTPDESALFHIASERPEGLLDLISSELNEKAISGALIPSFDSKILDSMAWLTAVKLHSDTKRFAFALLPDMEDLRSGRFRDRIDFAAAAGFCAIVFHPYLQKILPEDLSLMQELARQAESSGMFVIICSAYGSTKMFKHYSLPLAAGLAEEINCPIVLAHCGGAKIVEAYLVAEAYANIYLETSFTLPYWLGSSIEIDIAFAIRKLGPVRWLFGSDAPFCTLNDALAAHHKFFDTHGFIDSQVEQIMSGTARTILGW